MIAAVNVEPDGPSTPARLAASAARYGYDGIVLLAPPRELEPRYLDRIERRYDVGVIPGAELAPDRPGEIGGAIDAARDRVEVLCARGNGSDMNRLLARQERIDVLRWPLRGPNVSHTIATDARDHGVFIEVDLGGVLRSHGGQRVERIDELHRLFTILEHFDVPHVVSTTPTSHLQLRAPRELCGVGTAIGLPAEFIETGLRAWGSIARRTRRLRHDKFIEPGVRYADHEEIDR